MPGLPFPPFRVPPGNKAEKMNYKKNEIGTFRQVWNGTKLITKNGLRKVDLIKNKKNKIVSKSQHEKQGGGGKKKLSLWTHALKKARVAIKAVGFVLVNRGPMGIKLYKKAKEIYAVMKKEKAEAEAKAKEGGAAELTKTELKTETTA